MSELAVRPARAGDAPALARMHVAFGEYYVGIGGDDFRVPDADGLAGFIAADVDTGPDTAFLVAELADGRRLRPRGRPATFEGGVRMNGEIGVAGLRLAIATGVAVTVAVALAFAGGAHGGATAPSLQAFPRAFVGCWQRHAGRIPELDAAAGTWSVAIKVNGAATVYKPPARSCKGAVAFRTKIGASGADFSIGAVPKCRARGVYRWLLSGTSLYLKASADKGCALRLKIFTGTWQRQ